MEPNNYLSDDMFAIVSDSLGRTNDAMNAVHRTCTRHPQLCEGKTEQQYFEELRSRREVMFGPNISQPR